MPFGIIGRAGPGMRQVVGFGDRSSGWDTFGGEFVARHCIQWGLTAYMCDSASTVGAAVWGGACGGPMHCCIKWGVHVVQGEGEVLWVFVSHFNNGKCHYVADGEMFPIRIQ